MRKFIPCLFVGLTALIVLLACQQPMAPKTALSSGSPEARAAGLIDLLVTAQATGDFSQVNAQAAADDPSGKLGSVVGEYETTARGLLSWLKPTPPPEEVKLPEFDATEAIGGGTRPLYENGDVLVCRGSSSPISNAMNLVLTAGYGHAGIFDEGIYEATKESLGSWDAYAILSADIDFLTDPGPDADGGQSWALNYETYRDWVTNNDIITVLHSTVGGQPGPHATANVYSHHQGSIYTFIDLSFNPINRDNNRAWYCSMVPWRAYHQSYEDGGTEFDAVSIENAGFYGIHQDASGVWQPDGNPDDKWTVFRSSLLYQVYKIYLWLQNPWSSTLQARADRQLIQVLGELITPDELRTSDRLKSAFYADTSGWYHLNGDATDMEVVW